MAVNEIQSGSSGASSSAAAIAAFALSVSKMVSMRSKSTPPSASAADLLGVGVANLVERGVAEGGVVDARRERERDVERADRAGDEARARSPHLGRCRASRAPSRFISWARASRP